MSVKRIKSGKARGLLGQIMNEVYYKGNDFIVERGKKAMAVIISIDEYEKIQKERGLYKSIIETAEVLNDTELMNALKQSIKEMEEGETVPWEKVEKELDEKFQHV